VPGLRRSGSPGSSSSNAPTAPQRVVSESLDCDDDYFGRDDCGDLGRPLEHLVVVRDQPVPPELVQPDDQWAIVKVGQAWVDLVQAL
jgi:hypothetical protein